MSKPGTTTQRGYGSAHQRERAKWKPHVDAGLVQCHAKRHVAACLARDLWLIPGQPWDLGHNEERTAWTGPEFRSCNRADGGRRRHRTTTRRLRIL